MWCQMKICPQLEAILSDRDHEILVLVTNLLSPEDRATLTSLGMRPSRLDGEKAFIGKLKPSQISSLKDKLDHRAKIEIERSVPRSRH